MSALQDNNSVQLFRKVRWRRWWKTASSIWSTAVHQIAICHMIFFVGLPFVNDVPSMHVGWVVLPCSSSWKFPAASRLCIFVRVRTFVFNTTPVKCTWLWCVRLPRFIFCVQCHLMCPCVLYGWYHGSLCSSQRVFQYRMFRWPVKFSRQIIQIVRRVPWAA